MRIKTSVRIALVVCLASAPVSWADDRFEAIKAELVEAACTHIRFLSIIESQIFDQVDTAQGEALIAGDGRYRVAVGPDEYLSTKDTLYSYSKRHNQVTVEPLAPDIERLTEVSFVIRLDDFFKTAIIQPDLMYKLIRDDGEAVGLPDSITLYLHPEREAIDRIEYFDINGEMNRIVFLSIDPMRACEEGRFDPSYADSVDVVRLY